MTYIFLKASLGGWKVLYYANTSCDCQLVLVPIGYAPICSNTVSMKCVVSAVTIKNFSLCGQ